MNLIEIRNLSFQFEDNVLFEKANLDVHKQEITGVIGPNGCGKSTLFNLIMNKEDAPDIKINSGLHRNHILLMSQEFAMPGLLTVEEAMALILNVNNATVNSTIHLTEQWSTKERSRFQRIRKKRCSQCSVGERKWIYLRIVLTLDKDLYILDEPTAGVDPEYRLEIWALLKEAVKNNKSFVISSHLLDEIANNCSKINLINNRTIESYSSTESLLAKYKSKNLDEAFLNALA